MIKNKYLQLTILFSSFFSFLPTILLFALNSFKIPFVPTEIADDTLYYLSRVNEVLNGNFFIGNPYILENINNPTTAFFVGDFIYSLWFYIFSFLNIPLIYSFLFSQFFWTIVLGVLLYILYKKIELKEIYIPWAVLLSLISSLMYIWRPVAMAVVFPCFIFFLISFFDFIKNPNGKREKILFTISSVSCFYIYTYLWQIVLVCLFFLFIWSLYKKENRVLFLRLYSLIFILSIPVFIYTYKQITAPFYFETLGRVGLINTHSIGFSALLYMFIIFISFLIIFILKNNLDYRQKTFFSLVFLGLLFSSISNVFSGKDLETAVHIGRFIEMFSVIFLVFILSFYQKYITGFGVKNKIIVSFSILLLVFYIFSLVFFSKKVVTTFIGQDNKEEYKTLLKSLDDITEKPIVVLSDDQISSYIPVMTNNYVLFHPNALLYLSSNKEIEDRYLLSRVFMEGDENLFKIEYRKYAGVGNAIHKANIHNRNVKICFLIKKIWQSKKCSEFKNSFDFLPANYFENLYSRYEIIQRNKDILLDRYNVKLIVVDIDKSGFDLKSLFSLKNFELFGRNDRFLIFKRI